MGERYGEVYHDSGCKGITFEIRTCEGTSGRLFGKVKMLEDKLKVGTKLISKGGGSTYIIKDKKCVLDFEKEYEKVILYYITYEKFDVGSWYTLDKLIRDYYYVNEE